MSMPSFDGVDSSAQRAVEHLATVQHRGCRAGARRGRWRAASPCSSGERTCTASSRASPGWEDRGSGRSATSHSASASAGTGKDRVLQPSPSVRRVPSSPGTPTVKCADRSWNGERTCSSRNRGSAARGRPSRARPRHPAKGLALVHLDAVEAAHQAQAGRRPPVGAEQAVGDRPRRRQPRFVPPARAGVTVGVVVKARLADAQGQRAVVAGARFLRQQAVRRQSHRTQPSGNGAETVFHPSTSATVPMRSSMERCCSRSPAIPQTSSSRNRAVVSTSRTASPAIQRKGSASWVSTSWNPAPYFKEPSIAPPNRG